MTSRQDCLALQKVVCSECELVEQIWIYGNSYENFLVAVVIPDEKHFKSFASQAGAQGSSLEELCKDSKVTLLKKNPHTHTHILLIYLLPFRSSIRPFQSSSTKV